MAVLAGAVPERLTGTFSFNPQLIGVAPASERFPEDVADSSVATDVLTAFADPASSTSSGSSRVPPSSGIMVAQDPPALGVVASVAVVLCLS